MPINGKYFDTMNDSFERISRKFVLRILISMALMTSGVMAHAQGNSNALKISAFKDIAAFILDQISSRDLMALDVSYVSNASQAHEDLKQQRADLVFMSYDDTLSIALQEGHGDIVAVMPVHGGILDLCGDIDIAAGKVNIGIDTDTGYARALRAYLKKSYTDQDYEKLNFVFAGATNIRYEKLLDQAGGIDATLLNPPYSYGEGVDRLYRLSDAFGAYQGVVANTNRSWLAVAENEKKLRKFSKLFYETVQNIKNSPGQSIAALQKFYGISSAQASAAFNRIWEPDGLYLENAFNPDALAATREIFMKDAGLQSQNTDVYTYTLVP